MQKITHTITRILAAVLTVLMAVIVLDVTWQVVTRFILHNPSSHTEELAGFLLIWIGLLGSSYAYHTRAHLGIDVLTYRLTGTRRQVVEIIIHLMVLSFALFILVIGGLRLVNLTFTLRQVSAAMGLKMGYVYLVLPISGSLIIFYAIAFMVETIKQQPKQTTGPSISVID